MFFPLLVFYIVKMSPQLQIVDEKGKVVRVSIYKQVLGDQFSKLHPMLQKRYASLNKETFIGKGIMKTITGPKWLFPFLLLGTKYNLLFPEKGTQIPFMIINSPRIGINGENQIHWKRIFYFGKKERYFNALMSLDSDNKVVKDYLGEPSVLYADLSFSVTKEGYMYIESKRQRMVLGSIEIPLPMILQGIATVLEKYEETKDVYTIKVVVKNPLIGLVFSYEGEFTSDDIS
ncbi:uncharacterized protein DUF4166 [Pseudogracilibacillus auburnensis]|uniref:Uncharacterized protein DUF4166 n=1 Tax=Pseudogracilibacillus auburnensis TaxID=1494959 RepID=A0A2V3W490_9BACI|nr:uncharacterized protein DUF4166 [Pseudogracilibacillus auburnensis]